MQDGRKAIWSIPYVSLAFFPSLKQNFIVYRSSKVSSRPDCIFEIHQLWQSGFSWVYSNCCCSCSFEAEIIKIGQSSHKTYSNNIVNFQESRSILNACTKKSGNLLKTPRKSESKGLEGKHNESPLKKKVPGALVSKEGHADSLYGYENIHHYWFPCKMCNCKKCFLLSNPSAKFPLFIEWSLYQALSSLFSVLKEKISRNVNNIFCW